MTFNEVKNQFYFNWLLTFLFNIWTKILESILNLENQLLDGKIDLESRKFLVTSIIAGLSGESDHTIYEANDPFEESIDRLVEVFLKVLVESNSVYVPSFKNETYQQNMRENLIQFIELGDLSSLAFNIYRDNM